MACLRSHDIHRGLRQQYEGIRGRPVREYMSSDWQIGARSRQAGYQAIAIPGLRNRTSVGR